MANRGESEKDGERGESESFVVVGVLRMLAARRVRFEPKAIACAALRGSFPRRTMRLKENLKAPVARKLTHALRRCSFGVQTSLGANQSLEPTPMLVTDRAFARSAPSTVVAHL